MARVNFQRRVFMLAKRLIALFAALVMGLSFAPAQASERAQVEVLAQFYAQYYDVPLELVRRVINRESTFNPAARNGPYYGLMQILPATARTMGFRGQPSDLLDAETNLIYAVKYLRGAWLLANGSHDRAVQLYAKGYYYEAKAAGLLEQTGLRPGPATPVAPLPPTATQEVVVATAAPASAPVADVVEPAAVEPAEVIAVAALDTQDTQIAPLGFLPPQRPLGLELEDDRAEPQSDALSAIAAAQTLPVPERRQEPPVDPITVAAFQAPLQSGGTPSRAQVDPAPLRPSISLISDTFALFEAGAGAQ